MSTFSNASSSHQTSPPQPDLLVPEDRKCSNTDAQHCTGTPLAKTGKVASAVGKLWKAFKQPKTVFAKHWNGRKSLQKIMQRRTKQPAITFERGRYSSDAVNLPNFASAPNPSEAIIQETVLEDPSPAHAIYTCPSAIESTISLSSRPDLSPIPTPPLDIPQPVTIVNLVEDESRSIRPGTRLSQASTLQNSTVVNDDSSRRPSETPSSLSLSESIGGPITEVNLPPIPSLIVRPFPARLQTNFDLLNVPGSDDEDSHSTVRGRSGSSPASAVDFQGIGRHLEEPSAH